MLFAVSCSSIQAQDKPLKVGDEFEINVSTAHPYALSAKVGYVFEKTFSSEKASYVKLYLRNFELAPGDYLEVYDPDSPDDKVVYGWEGKLLADGAYTNEFWTNTIYAEHIIVRLFSQGKSDYYGFDIVTVAYGYPEAFLDQLLHQNESICGKDDKENWMCYEGTLMWEKGHPVCRLLIGGSGLCTGWLLGCDGHVMTNNHCINNANKAQNTEFRFNYHKNSCNGTANSSQDIVANTSTLIKTNGSLDYTLVKLPNNAGKNAVEKYGYLSLRSWAAQTGERIYINQHPGGSRKKIAVLDDKSNSGYAEVKSSTWDRVGYKTDTEGGSSGSPVLSYNEHLVLALHNTGGCNNGGNRSDRIISNLGDLLPPCGADDNNLDAPPIAKFEKNKDCNTVRFTDNSIGQPTSWHWDFGDGNTSTQRDPVHTYSEQGNYDVTLTAWNAFGNDTKTRTVSINLNPPPSGVGTQICAGRSAYLKAFNAGKISWYDAAVGGSFIYEGDELKTPSLNSNTTYYAQNTSACSSEERTAFTVEVVEAASTPDALDGEGCEGEEISLGASGSTYYAWYDSEIDGTFLGTGSTFTTPALQQTTTYYVSGVSNPPLITLGAPNKKIGDNDYRSGTDKGHRVDVHQDVIWKQTTMYSQTADTCTIVVEDADKNTLVSKEVVLTSGKNIVDLNLSIPAGEGYGFRVDGDFSLLRNSNGANYPFSSNLLSILVTYSNAVNNYYFYFYNNSFEALVGCSNDVRVPVTATAMEHPDTPEIALITNTTTDVLQTASGYNAYEWYLNGELIPGASDYQLEVNEPGTYTVVVSNGNDCSAESEEFHYLLTGVHNGIEDRTMLYPNPSAEDNVTLHNVHDFSFARIYDASGNQVLLKTIDKAECTINVASLLPGVYTVSLRSEQNIKRMKFVKH